MPLSDFLSRVSEDDSDPYEIIPISLNTEKTLKDIITYMFHK